MFIGHFAPAFAARAITSEAPKLGTLFIGAQLVDWAFFAFAAMGIEKMRVVPGITEMVPFDLYYMPYTHSLVGTAVFAAVFAAAIFFVTRNAVAATWGAIVVACHWLFDWLVHRPDMTIAGTEPKLGLSLWDHPAIAMPLEIGIVALAFLFYIRRTKGPIVPPLVLIAVMLLFQAINWFGAPPEAADFSLYATALFAFAVMTALAHWVGTTRWHRNEVGLGVASPPI